MLSIVDRSSEQIFLLYGYMEVDVFVLACSRVLHYINEFEGTIFCVVQEVKDSGVRSHCKILFGFSD